MRTSGMASITENSSATSRDLPTPGSPTMLTSWTTDSWRLLWKDRKSTRLNSSHGYISYAVFCLKKKKNVRPATASYDLPAIGVSHHHPYAPVQTRVRHCDCTVGRLAVSAILIPLHHQLFAREPT